jgi:hypothetical protein
MAHAEIPAIKLQQVESVHEPVSRPLSAVTPAACIRETMGRYSLRCLRSAFRGKSDSRNTSKSDFAIMGEEGRRLRAHDERQRTVPRRSDDLKLANNTIQT